MPIKSSKVKDARPAINAEAESDKGLFQVKIEKGNVRVTRGGGRQVAFVVKYGEINELSNLLTEVAELLDKNQYDTSESLGEEYEAPSTKYVPENPRGPRGSSVPTAAQPAAGPHTEVGEGTTPSESGVISSATQGTSITPEQNTIDPSLASGAEAQAAFDAQGDTEEPEQEAGSAPVTSEPESKDEPDYAASAERVDARNDDQNPFN